MTALAEANVVGASGVFVIRFPLGGGELLMPSVGKPSRLTADFLTGK
jgi:hypothetical protein